MKKQETVLITGATGLLGQQILIQLVAQDYKIFAVKRVMSLIPLVSKDINWIEIQSTDDNLFSLISEPIDFVIHAGAFVSYKKSDQYKIFQINTHWTSKLAVDAKEAGVKKFIFISSISALGKNSSNNLIDENTPSSKNEFITNYGHSKRQAEQILWKLSDTGLSIVILNPSVILGPAKRYQSSAQLFGYVGDQKPFYTKGLINYVDARDVAKIIIETLKSRITNEQFILSTGSISYHDFFKLIAKELEVKKPSIRIPKFMVIFGAIVENLLSKIRRKPPTLTIETAKMAGNNNIYQAAKARTSFDIRYKSINQSIEWTVGEMKKKGEL